MKEAFLHLDFLSTLFIFVIGCGALVTLLLFIHDKLQTRNAIKHNYPVMAWFRLMSQKFGEFYRRYISY